MEFQEFLEAVQNELHAKGLWANEKTLREEWSRMEADRMPDPLKPSDGNIDEDEQSVTIGGLRVPKEVSFLKEIAHSEDRDAQIQAIRALGEIHEPHAVLALKEIFLCELNTVGFRVIGVEVVRALRKSSGYSCDAEDFLKEKHDQIIASDVRREITRRPRYIGFTRGDRREPLTFPPESIKPGTVIKGASPPRKESLQG